MNERERRDRAQRKSAEHSANGAEHEQGSALVPLLWVVVPLALLIAYGVFSG